MKNIKTYEGFFDFFKKFYDFNRMILKTIHRIEGGRVPYDRDCVRNITVKIKALGGIES